MAFSPLVEDITVDTLPPLLATRDLGRVLYSFGQCESTNLCARRLLEAERSGYPGQVHGTLLVSDFQTSGRGRNGRAWSSSKGQSLLFSVILKMQGNALSDPVAVTFAAAVAVAQALRHEGVAGCSIKWPNDVLAPDGRKICGILTEYVETAPGRGAFILGIGVNVNQRAEDFPEVISSIAVSARMVLGRPVSRLKLLAAVLEGLEDCLCLSREALMERWQRFCSTLGLCVRVRIADREITGQAVGVDGDGSLILRLPNGGLENVRSGEVREVRPDN